MKWPLSWCKQLFKNTRSFLKMNYHHKSYSMNWDTILKTANILENEYVYFNLLSLLLCLCFTSTVNSYGNVGKVSWKTTLFLGKPRPPKQLTSAKCINFHQYVTVKQCRPWSDCSCRISLIRVCTVCTNHPIPRVYNHNNNLNVSSETVMLY